jgi:hypothetical protein
MTFQKAFYEILLTSRLSSSLSVLNFQNCWVSGLCSAFNILKKTFRKLDLLPSSGETKEGESGVKKPTQLGPLESTGVPVIESSFF